jgi:hypothetical protein
MNTVTKTTTALGDRPVTSAFSFVASLLSNFVAIVIVLATVMTRIAFADGGFLVRSEASPPFPKRRRDGHGR